MLEALAEYWPLLLVAAFGLAIGILSGMFGVGGGVMIVPMLSVAFRLPMLAATSTSLFSIAPTSISGSLRHLRQKSVDVGAGLRFGIPGAVASAASAALSGRLPDWVASAAAVAIIGYSAYRVLREALKPPLDESGRTAEPRFESKRTTDLATIATGFAAGFIAGLVGVGGGFIIVPIGLALFGKTMKEMSAISLLAIAIIALPGIATHAMLGHIRYDYGLALACGTVPGASLGAWLVARMPERALRLAYAALLVVSCVLLFLNSFVF